MVGIIPACRVLSRWVDAGVVVGGYALVYSKTGIVDVIVIFIVTTAGGNEDRD